MKKTIKLTRIGFLSLLLVILLSGSAYSISWLSSYNKYDSRYYIKTTDDNTIFELINNATYFKKGVDDMGNSTAEIFSVVDNGTFLKSYENLTDADIAAFGYIKTDTYNTSAEIVVVKVDNATHADSASLLDGQSGSYYLDNVDTYNTTSDIQAVAVGGNLTGTVGAAKLGANTVASSNIVDNTVTSSDLVDTYLTSYENLTDSDIAAFGYIKVYENLTDSDILAFGYNHTADLKTYFDTLYIGAGTKLGNTTIEIFETVNNGTYFKKGIDEVGNSSAEIAAVKVNNATWADGSAKLGGQLPSVYLDNTDTYNTTADIQAVTMGGNATGTIGAFKLAANSVSTGNIVPGTIVAADLADTYLTSYENLTDSDILAFGYNHTVNIKNWVNAQGFLTSYENLTDSNILSFGYNHTVDLTTYFNTLYITVGTELGNSSAEIQAVKVTNATHSDTTSSVGWTSVTGKPELGNSTVQMFEASNNGTYQKEIGAPCVAGDFAVGVLDNGTVNCSTPAGAGDITAVNTAGKYLTGGAASGDVSLLVNETELNATGDLRYYKKTEIDTQGEVESIWSVTLATDSEVTSANTSMKGYVDAQDVAANTSLKGYVDANFWDADGDIAADEITEGKIAFSTACAAGNHYYLSGNDLACEADDDTTYTAADGIILSGTIFSWNTTYGDARYYLKTAIDTVTEMNAIWSITIANKTYVDAQDTAQDECSEITGCIENAITSYENLTDSDISAFGYIKIDTYNTSAEIAVVKVNNATWADNVATVAWSILTSIPELGNSTIQMHNAADNATWFKKGVDEVGNSTAQIQAVKVDNATWSDDSAKLGGQLPSVYLDNTDTYNTTADIQAVAVGGNVSGTVGAIKLAANSVASSNIVDNTVTSSDLVDTYLTAYENLTDSDISAFGYIKSYENLTAINIKDFGFVNGSNTSWISDNDNDTIITDIYANTDTDSTDDLVDTDFGSAGLMKTDGGGSYSVITDSSTNWDRANTYTTNSTFYLATNPSSYITSYENLTDGDILVFGYNHTTDLTTYFNTLYITIGTELGNSTIQMFEASNNGTYFKKGIDEVGNSSAEIQVVKVDNATYADDSSLLGGQAPSVYLDDTNTYNTTTDIQAVAVGGNLTGTVGTGKLGANSVASSNIVDGTVAAADLVDTYLTSYTETDPQWGAWDNITGIPVATPSDGDVTHLSNANQIRDYVIGLGYSTTTGTVTSVAAGNGMDFSSITASGSVTMGTPGTLTGATTNALTATSHTHAITTDSSGDCGTGVICAGDHIHSQYMEDLIDDATPQLNGNLDTNNHNITINQDYYLCLNAGCDAYIMRNATHTIIT